MTHVDVSLDLETWGTRAGCDIRSIGATVFVAHTGAVCTPEHVQTQPGYASGTFYVAVENWAAPEHASLPNITGSAWHWDRVDRFRSYPLWRDPQTVQWWSEQSAEAQGAFSNPVDLAEGLLQFSKWLDAIEATRIWAHGSHFDIPILEAAYHAIGGKAPWYYRAPRDTRTIFDAAGINDHSGYLTSFATDGEVYHHALGDAIVQARAICAAMRKVNPWQQ
jgi:hypothetical protein